jgi:hypothetical protein
LTRYEFSILSILFILSKPGRREAIGEP